MADSKGTAVATRDETKKATPALSPERQAKIDAAKAQAAVAKAIRGTIWGKDCAPLVVDAVVAYCRQNHLDAVRHVEVLGGNIYLTSTFYDERGAPLLHSGEVVFAEPDYINVDPRLEELAKAGDAWAIEERARRLKERIKWNVPEAAKAAVVQRAKLRSGMDAVGVNWCGGLQKRDPVGDAEPAKTAQTRARRRAWRQIADFVPSYAAAVRSIEQNAKTALPVAVIEAPAAPAKGTTSNLGPADDPYRLNSGPATPAEHQLSDEELLEQDRELAESEGAGRTREPGEE
jgi:hypothetical protein